MDQRAQVVSRHEPSRFFLLAWFDAFAHRLPFWALVVVILISNIGGTAFSFFYNTQLIVERILTPSQKIGFWDHAVPIYNAVAWPTCVAAIFYVLWPLMRCLGQLRRGEIVEPAFLEFCRRRLVNFPIFLLLLNLIGMLPGAFIFPWVITAKGGTEKADDIWLHFTISFFISAVFTTAQTFFLLQSFLTAYLYPDFFKVTRPDAVPGVINIPFTLRLVMLWIAIVLMPLIGLLTVALTIDRNNPEHQMFAVGVGVASALSGAAIFWLVGRDLWGWIQQQTEATEQIADGNFDIRIDQPRSDEWGRLTNNFNDMATSLSQAWDSHETLGQLVSPQVRDQILHNNRGFDVSMQEITVMFVDIRGFTTRCASESPQRIGELLNRFLTLAVRAIEGNGGYVNKFLGDGVMALFGATQPHPDHADFTLASARELLIRLRDLNAELVAQGQVPLVVGIGIHTGTTLVGCFGATVVGEEGQPLIRREFTAIGETVNLCQRIEQLTKKVGGPILLSEFTRSCLRQSWPLEVVGPQELLGSPTPMLVHRVVTA